MKMKGELTRKLLETIGGAFMGTADFFAAFLRAGYGASTHSFDYHLYQVKKKRERGQAAQAEERAVKQRYYNFVAYLRRDGLIEEVTKDSRTFLRVTPKGRFKLKALNDRADRHLPSSDYAATAGNSLVIVAFDIPERMRWKRAWLRAVLKRLGLKFVQRSLWMGKVRIPKELIEDLNRFRMVDFIEIFEVSKEGSLRHLL